MRTIFNIDTFNFSLYDVSTSIIFNNENIKNAILKKIQIENSYIIDSRLINQNTIVGSFLKKQDFDMKLIPYFGIENLVSKKLTDLYIEEQLYIKIIILLTTMDGLVIFDDVLSYISDTNKKKILKYIKQNNIRFINFTSDIEEVLYTNYLIVLSSKGVAIEGKTKEVLNEEKILKRLGFSLPVIYDISKQLKAYGVIEEEFFDIDKLVVKLWN